MWDYSEARFGFWFTEFSCCFVFLFGIGDFHLVFFLILLQLQKFVTNHNKRIVGSLLAAGSIAELFGFFAPETVFIQDYKNLLTFKEMEEPYPLSPKIIQAKNEVYLLLLLL